MAINWNFNSNDVEESFPLIPAGDHRVRIASAEEKKSSKGNDMIELSLDISNYPGHLFYYLVFLPNNTTMTNTNLKRLWESFGIETGNMDTSSWVGRVGAARVKHEEYNGDQTARISYFIERKKQDKLPVWVEKSSGGAAAPAPVSFTPLPDDTQTPFDVGDLPL